MSVLPAVPVDSLVPYLWIISGFVGSNVPMLSVADLIWVGLVTRISISSRLNLEWVMLLSSRTFTKHS